MLVISDQNKNTPCISAIQNNGTIIKFDNKKKQLYSLQKKPKHMKIIIKITLSNTKNWNVSGILIKDHFVK